MEAVNWAKSWDEGCRTDAGHTPRDEGCRTDAGHTPRQTSHKETYGLTKSANAASHQRRGIGHTQTGTHTQRVVRIYGKWQRRRKNKRKRKRGKMKGRSPPVKEETQISKRGSTRERLLRSSSIVHQTGN